MIKNPTDLEALLNSSIEFKLEVLNFLGYNSTLHNNDLVNFNKQKHIKWIQEHLKLINNNLSKFNIVLSIAGNGNDNESIKKFQNKPSIILRSNNLIIQYNSGLFFNRFLISTSFYDIVQIEPNLQVYKSLNSEKYKKIQDIIEISTAELCQHVYNFNQDKETYE